MRINIERNKSITSQNTLITTNTIILKDNKMSESKELYTNTDTDFDLSKPVILNTKKNEENVKNNKKNKMQELTQTSTIIERNKNSSNSKKDKNVDELRIKNIIKKFNQSTPFENDRNITSKTIFEPKMSKKLLESSVNINTDTVKKLLDEIPEKEEEITEEKKKKIEEEIKKEEDIIVKKTSFNMEVLRNVFGENNHFLVN